MSVMWRNYYSVALFLCVVLLLGGIDIRAAAEDGCIYRNSPRMPPDIFSLWGCWGCYDYSIFLNRVIPGEEIPVHLCRMEGYNVPCYNETWYFDWHDPAVVEEVNSTMITERYTAKWIECCEAADACCERVQQQPEPDRGCPALWDGWACWDEAPRGTVALTPCPNFIYSGSGHSCDLHSRKECYNNGTWNVQTDYGPCSHAPRLRFRHKYHVGVLSAAIAISLPAIIIFIVCRRLHNSRVTLHRNLLLVIVIRNILVIIHKYLIILDELYDTIETESNMAENSAWCRTLTTLEKLATNAVFACMTLESVYLHRVLARAFRGQPNMTVYYISAAALCAVFATSWAAVMATENDFFCWTVDANGVKTHWINDSLRLALLLVNYLLLIDIVRVLLTRLKSVQTAQSSRIRRTTKATLLLAPVFGVPLLFTLVRPATRVCGSEQAYYLSAYTLESLQGPLVAILYCYTNTEVRQLLRFQWRRMFPGADGVVSPRPSFITDVTELPAPQDIDPIKRHGLQTNRASIA